jgi:osmoprotectant transport system ATP-binding protein
MVFAERFCSDMIRLEGVSHHFRRTGCAPVSALRDIDLEVRKGETIALLGPSGCGKTTTLRLVNRLISPTSGRVLLSGTDVAACDPVTLRRRIGYVVQSGALFPHLSVRRNLSLLCELEAWPKDQINHRVEELLKLVGLRPRLFLNRYPSELSGGQRQRVGIARALMLDPEILLMDEPFGALDPITRTRLEDEFQHIRFTLGKTIMIVTHDLKVAFALGDRVALLNEGHLVQVGTESELLETPANPWVRSFLNARNSQVLRITL